MCAVPMAMGALAGKVGGSLGALATGGLLGYAGHKMLGKKKEEPQKMGGNAAA